MQTAALAAYVQSRNLRFAGAPMTLGKILKLWQLPHDGVHATIESAALEGVARYCKMTVDELTEAVALFEFATKSSLLSTSLTATAHVSGSQPVHQTITIPPLVQPTIAREVVLKLEPEPTVDTATLVEGASPDAETSDAKALEQVTDAIAVEIERMDSIYFNEVVKQSLELEEETLAIAHPEAVEAFEVPSIGTSDGPAPASSTVAVSKLPKKRRSKKKG